MFTNLKPNNWRLRKLSCSGMFHTAWLSIQTKPRKFNECVTPHRNATVALNDERMSDLELLQNLLGIVFRFREHKNALTADIEAIFLQV